MQRRDQIIVDGQVIDLVDPALCTPLPTRADVRDRPDQAAKAAAVLLPSGDVMDVVTNLVPADLSDAGLIDALAATERLKAALEARQVELLAELHQRDPKGEEFLQDEVGCALKLAPGTAHARLEAATALTGRLWDTFELLRDGWLSITHARHLATACADLPDEVTAKVQQHVLPRATGQTPGEFTAAVRRAVAKYDAKDQAERHRTAVARRQVTREHVAEGMGWVNLYAPSDGIEIVWTALTAWSTKTDTQDDRTADQRRADALVELCGAALDLPGVPSTHGLRPTINVTVAATTLAGEDEQPGLVNGEPIPAELARRFAADPPPPGTPGSSTTPAESSTPRSGPTPTARRCGSPGTSSPATSTAYCPAAAAPPTTATSTTGSPGRPATPAPRTGSQYTRPPPRGMLVACARPDQRTREIGSSGVPAQ